MRVYTRIPGGSSGSRLAELLQGPAQRVEVGAVQGEQRGLAGEAAAFLVAGSIHAGLLVHGWEHRAATRAESVIALALLAALVGIFTIVVGVGPRTVPDVVYHVAIVTVLAAGLVTASRAPPDPGSA